MTLHQISHWTEIGLKAWYREMNHQVLKKKIHPKLMKSIIKLYDFEQYLPFPTAESTLRLEQIFGINGVLIKKRNGFALKVRSWASKKIFRFDDMP